MTAAETPSRLKRMVEAVRDASPLGGGGSNRSRLTADYQLAFAEIRKRLVDVKAKEC